MKEIRAKFAGIDIEEPNIGSLCVYFILDQTQTMIAGKKYKLILQGLSFAHKEADSETKGFE